MTKPIAELSVEQLMEIAKKPIKDDEYKKLPPAKRFIVSEGIEAGDYKVPAILIWDRYVKWAKHNKVKSVSQIAFFKELALYFDKVRLTNAYGYMVTVKGFDLSPSYVEYVKQLHKKGKRTSRGRPKKETNNPG